MIKFDGNDDDDDDDDQLNDEMLEIIQNYKR